MKRVGFLLQSLDCDQPMADLIQNLNQRDDVETVPLVLQDGYLAAALESRCQTRTARDGPITVVRQRLFHFWVRVEAWLGRCLSSDFRQALGSAQVGGGVVQADLQQSSSDPEVSFVSLAGFVDLDLVVIGSGIPTVIDETLPRSTDGLLRLGYGPGGHRDWSQLALAVLCQSPSTTYMIESRSTPAEPARVCRQGSVATRPSITRNRVDVSRIAHRQLELLLIDYLETGGLDQREEFRVAGASEENDPFDIPGVRTMFCYVGALVRRSIVTRLFSNPRAVDPEWHVGYISDAEKLSDISGANIIANPTGKYFADPFVIRHNGRTICFVEEFRYEEGYGCISAIELYEDDGYEILGSVIREDFHMSFPFVFEFEKRLYMVPETEAAGQLRLYVCDSFPMKWRYVKPCIDDLAAVDPLVFEYDGLWWLLCGIPIEAGNERDVALHVFFSSSPLDSRWEAHPLNPVLVDNCNARNGGMLDGDGELPIRVRQNQGFNRYGTGFSLARIFHLSPSTYEEREIDRLTVEGVPGVLGSHHLNGSMNILVTDFLMIPGSDPSAVSR